MIYRYVGLKPREGHDYIEQFIKIHCESNEFQDLCYRIKWYIGDNPQRYLIGAFSESFESFLDDLKDKMSGFFEENCYYNRQYINCIRF